MTDWLKEIGSLIRGEMSQINAEFGFMSSLISSGLNPEMLTLKPDT